MEEEPAKHCLECGDEIAYGKRSDSKFCCEHCRQRWHNRNRNGMYRLKERYDRILEKNYQILLGLFESQVRSIERSRIMAMGFRPEFATTAVHSRSSMLMTCYDITYRMSEQKIFFIEKRGTRSEPRQEKNAAWDF